MDTVAVVAGIVVVVLAVLACILIMSGGVAPVLEWGKLKLGFVPLRESPSPDKPPGNQPPPSREQATSLTDRRTIKERVLSLSCGKSRAG